MFCMNNKKGLILMLLCALLLSLGGVCIKEIPWNPLSINAFRSIISVGILFSFAKLTHNRFHLTLGTAVGTVGVCGATVLYTVATKLTTAGSAVLIQFTVAPVFIILFTWLVFKDWPKGMDVTACLCIVGGVICFFLDSLGSGRFAGDVVAVLSGVAYALVFLTNKLPGGNALWATILGQSIGALIGLPFPGAGDPVRRHHPLLRHHSGGVPVGPGLRVPDHWSEVRQARHGHPGDGDRAGAQPHPGGHRGGGDPVPPVPAGRRDRVCQRHGLQHPQRQRGAAQSAALRGGEAGIT